VINAERDRVDAGADVGDAAQFFDAAALALMGRSGNLTVLDFGCGDGALVANLRANGWTTFGCDFPGVVPEGDGLRAIVPEPYTLPFDDGTFDLVVSTSVLEHAANKRECFAEIARVLRPGGYAMHLYPPKWYLPREPHILVPLVNWFWPRCPRAWMALWARLGIRNSFQATMTWREAVADNQRYCRTGLSYSTTGQLRRLSLEVFGNCALPMRFYVEHAEGGAARRARRLPLKWLVDVIVRETRESFLVQWK
jgi:SAM-dependent methyltransferase